MKYRLEYNEQQAGWHYEDPSTDNVGTHGWVTIAKEEEEKKINIFTYMMDAVLLNLKDIDDSSLSVIDLIKDAWEAFDDMYQKLGFSVLVKDEDENKQ